MNITGHDGIKEGDTVNLRCTGTGSSSCSYTYAFKPTRTSFIASRVDNGVSYTCTQYCNGSIHDAATVTLTVNCKYMATYKVINIYLVYKSNRNRLYIYSKCSGVDGKFHPEGVVQHRR